MEWSVFQDLIGGRACAGCGRAGVVACTRCRDALTRPRPVHRAVDDFPPTWACAPYEPLGQQLIVALKERGRWDLAPVLSHALAGAVAAVCREHGWGSAALVPMPSRPTSVRARGSDVVRVIVKGSAKELRRAGLDVDVWPHLAVRGQLRDQVGLGRAQRRQNLQGHLRVQKEVPAVPLVVCDDVVTSGASMAEAALSLRSAGARKVVGVSIAARGWS